MIRNSSPSTRRLAGVWVGNFLYLNSKGTISLFIFKQTYTLLENQTTFFLEGGLYP